MNSQISKDRLSVLNSIFMNGKSVSDEKFVHLYLLKLQLAKAPHEEIKFLNGQEAGKEIEK